MAHITYVNEQCITFYIDESCHIIGDTKNNIIMSNNKYAQDKEDFDYICENYDNLIFEYDKNTMYFGLYDIPDYLCQTWFIHNTANDGE